MTQLPPTPGDFDLPDDEELRRIADELADADPAGFNPTERALLDEGLTLSPDDERVLGEILEKNDYNPMAITPEEIEIIGMSAPALAAYLKNLRQSMSTGDSYPLQRMEQDVTGARKGAGEFGDEWDLEGLDLDPTVGSDEES